MMVSMVVCIVNSTTGICSFGEEADESTGTSPAHSV